MKKIKLYVLITVVSIVLLAWLLVVVIVFQKNHADIFFFDNNKEIEYQYGNYKADALVVDGYVYLYRSVVELGNYDKKEKLEKCGNNVIYRLSPDGTYEEFYEFEDEDALYYDVNSKLYYYDEHFYIMIGQRVYRITKDGSSAQVIYENTGGNGIFRMFGIREHYLLLANHNEVRYLDMRKWDWSTPIDFDQMRVLKYVYALDADTFYNWMISGVTRTICVNLNILIIKDVSFFCCCHNLLIFNCFTIADNVILSADLAVISFKYQTSSSSINRSSNGLLILLLKVSAMWTYLSVVLMLLCPISSFTILMSVPCSSKWVANEWRSRCG
jgi:hypothetical protein